MKPYHISWRRWAQHKLQLAVLVCSLIMGVLFSYFVIKASFDVFEGSPDWISNESGYVTLGREGNASWMLGLRWAEFQSLSSVSGVNSTAWISRSSWQINADGRDIKTAGLLYSGSFLSFLKDKDLAKKISSTNGVWVTKKFVQTYLLGNESGRIYFPALNESFNVAGVLPNDIESLGVGDFSFILSERFLSYNTPFSYATNPLMADSFNLAAPRFITIASVDAEIFSANRAQTIIEDAYTDVSQMKFSVASHKLLVLDGVNLNPEAKHQKIITLVSLSLLLLVYMLVVVSATYSTYIGHIIRYKGELEIQKILGASLFDLMREQARCLFILFVSTLILAAFLVSVLEVYFLKYGGIGLSSTVKTNVIAFGASMTLIFALLSLCLLIFRALLDNEIINGRSSGLVSISKWQASFSTLIISLQVVVLVGALSAASSIVSTVVKNYQSYPAIAEVSVFDIQKRSDSTNMAMLVRPLIEQYPKSISYSLFSFDLPIRVGLSLYDSSAAYQASLQVIGDNYLDVLVPAHNGVVDSGMNQRLQLELAKQFSIQDSSQPVIITSLDKRLSLGAVYPNMPHNGRLMPPMASGYLLSNNYDILSSSITIYVKNDDVPALDKVNSWISQRSDINVTRKASLNELIADKDAKLTTLFIVSIVISLVLIATFVMSLVGQLNKRVELDARELAIMRALGAPLNSVILKASAPLLHIAVTSVVLTLAALLIVGGEAIHFYGVSVSLVSHIELGVVAVLACALIAFTSVLRSYLSRGIKLELDKYC